MTRVEIDNKLKERMVRSILSDYMKNEINQEDFDQYLARINGIFERDDIAIIGISCELPDASDHVQFWENLMKEKESIKRFPPKRLEDYRKAFDFSGEGKLGGYLDEIDQFDADYFRITPNMAKQMDPHHKKTLEAIINCIEDAGYFKEQLFDTKTGVFIGHDHTHRLLENYFHFIPESEIDLPLILGATTGILASRISHLLNLKGPAMVLDSACASAMLAIDTAISSIEKGDCETALVGGINLFLGSDHRTQSALSPDHQIRAFDNKANGTMWSEGVAFIYIKPFSKAVLDKDHIYGVIKSIALNNDGETSSLTAPNKNAQRDVVLQAWEKRGINPEDISYIETHGTGTILGDPLEISGLTEAFRVHTNKKQFCGVGSVKTNIGHTVALSGIASLIKILMCFKRGIIPATINFAEPNQLIDFVNSPLYVQSQQMRWTDFTQEVMVGVSTFGFTGTNAHLVVKSHSSERTKNDFQELIFPLSAKNGSLMIKTVDRLQKFLKAGAYQIEDVSYTMSCCRNHQNFRAVIITNNNENLLNALSYLKTSLYQGNEKLTPTGESYRIYYDCGTPEALEYANQCLLNYVGSAGMDFSLDFLALRYVKKENLDFSSLFDKMQVFKCSLPPAEFDRKRFWETRTAKKTTPPPLEVVDEIEIKPPTNMNDLIRYSWSKALGHDSIKPDDNFFELGGDSISGFQITGYLSEVLQIEIPSMGILNHPALPDYIAYINNLQRNSGANTPDTNSIQPSNDRANMPDNNSIQPPDAITEIPNISQEIEEVNNEEKTLSERLIIPLNSAQRGIYFISQMMTDGIDDNVISIMPSDNHSVERINDIKNAARQLMERHDALRASFFLEDVVLVQEIHHQVDANVETFHVESEPALIEKTLKNKIREISRPFNLNQPPLFRIYNIIINDAYHFIVFDVHHIITDGVSTGILMREFAMLLNETTLPKKSDNYPQIMKRIYEREEQATHAHLHWWLEGFQDGVPALSIITDRPRPTHQNYRGFRVKTQLARPTVDRLKTLASTTGCTLYMVLLSGLYRLICQLTHETDHVIGTLSSNRSSPEEWNTVGMFVKTLPLRINLDQRMTVSDSFLHLKQLVTDCFSHQDFNYEMLLDKLGVKANSPLFDVYFAFQNIDMGIDQDNDFIQHDVTGTKFNMMVIAREAKDGLVIDWECRSELFDTTTIERLSSRYITLLERMVRSVNNPLGELDHLPERERELILEEFNNTHQEPSSEKTVVHLFEEQVRKTPDHIAIEFEDESITYEDLNARANILAYKLRVLDVRPDDHVVIVTEKSIDMVVGMCGIIKAGAAYVPIDPTYPVERISYILNDCRPRAVVIGDQEIELAVNVPVIKIRDGNVFTRDFDNLDAINKPSDLMYLIYTSGTTGKPKGVMVEHKNAVSLVKNTNYVDFNDISIAQAGSLMFDATTFEIWGALLNGGKVVLLSEATLLNPVLLKEEIISKEINTLFVTTALYNQIIDLDPSTFAPLKQLLFGGEVTSEEHVRKLVSSNPETYFANVYGPTEVTTFSLDYPITKETLKEKIPIGKPMNNTQAYILNNMSLCGIGDAGELCLAGDGVARGYVNRPDITDEKFIPNPFGEGKLYRTGDLARWQPDGNIEYLGRLDDQVKIRGYRIELGEIKSVFRKIEKVADVAVLVREDGTGEKAIYAYFTAKEELSIDILKAGLRLELPNYMIPAYMMQIAQIPLTPNGKLNHDGLPEIRKISAAEYVAPQTEIEVVLVKIWEEVFNRENIGINDDFFDLGGHSLTAMTIINRISSELGVNIPVAELYDKPNVGSLASYIATADDSELNIDGLILLKRAKESDKNFFFVHAGSGKGSAFLKLATILEHDFNYWGFDYNKMDPCIPTIEELATKYISKLKQVQESGPYYLSGWCVGGMIAFEIARRLVRQGDEFKFFGLYNTAMFFSTSLTVSRPSLEAELSFVQHIFPEYNFPESFANLTSVEELWRLLGEDLDKNPHYEKAKLEVYRRVCRLHPHAERIFADPEKVMVKEILQLINLIRGFRDVHYTYHTDRINTKIDYFIATQERGDNLELWKNYSVHGVNYYDVDADHFSMFQEDDHVQELSEKLSKVLDQIG